MLWVLIRGDSNGHPKYRFLWRIDNFIFQLSSNISSNTLILFPDIDECIDSPPCDSVRGICANTDGGYTCACNDGYTLGPNNVCNGTYRMNYPPYHYHVAGVYACHMVGVWRIITICIVCEKLEQLVRKIVD